MDSFAFWSFDIHSLASLETSSQGDTASTREDNRNSTPLEGKNVT